MDIKPFLASLTKEERAEIAGRCGVTLGHLHNVMYKTRPCTPMLAWALERETGGRLTRVGLLSQKQIAKHWPELVPARIKAKKVQ